MLTTQCVGRNDTCCCGSGRKFKVCCLRKGSSNFLEAPILKPRLVYGDGASLLPLTQTKVRQSTGNEKPIKRIPVHYTYDEPFGQAICSYCFPVDQTMVLENGNVIHAEWLQEGMKFRMVDGTLGTVTQVDPPKVWDPPSRVPDQHGNYAQRVLGTIRHKGYIVIDITFGGETITGTPDHQWYSVDRAAWVPAETLRRGERLMNAEGATVRVEHVSESRTGLVDLYNIEVEELHTFFVGHTQQSSALVHNGQGNYIKPPLTATQSQRSIASLERRTAEHQKKLSDYLANPHAFDHKGFLKNAPTPEIRQSIIDGRARHLQGEIDNFNKKIAVLRGLLGGG